MQNDAKNFLTTLKTTIGKNAEESSWGIDAKKYLKNGLNPLSSLANKLGTRAPSEFHEAVFESGAILQAGTEPEHKNIFTKGVTYLKDATRNFKFPQFNPGGLTPG